MLAEEKRFKDTDRRLRLDFLKSDQNLKLADAKVREHVQNEARNKATLMQLQKFYDDSKVEHGRLENRYITARLLVEKLGAKQTPQGNQQTLITNKEQPE